MSKIKQFTNEEITADKMVLIDEEGNSLGLVSYDQAMLLASDKELDLVLVNSSKFPPIAKIVDYAKELYRKEKIRRKHKAKQKNTETKEVKLSLNIGEHDLNTKIQRANDFFERGHKVRVLIFLRGRENLFRDKAYELIERFKTMLNASYDVPVKNEGKRYFAIIKK